MIQFSLGYPADDASRPDTGVDQVSCLQVSAMHLAEFVLRANLKMMRRRLSVRMARRKIRSARSLATPLEPPLNSHSYSPGVHEGTNCTETMARPHIMSSVEGPNHP